MLPVEQPFKVYTGRDGKPLDNGYVYFGQPNQNPITAPVTVYWDSAGTQPAAQPLRTDNGYIVRNGTPANVFFNSSYSELVQDSRGRQVFYARTSDDFSIATTVLNFITNLAASAGSSLIGFIQAGAGAVLRTVQDKLRDTVSVKDFGAVGNGVADDTAKIQAALDAMSAAGGGTVFAPPGQYRLTAKLTIPSFVLLKGGDFLPDPSNSAQTLATSLFIDWGAGADNHAVEMSHSSGIEGFTFYYPGQVAKTASTPIAFGFSISTPTAVDVYDNIHVRNITLYNSYKGIRLNNGGRWNVENVQGDPLFMGFTASDCLDACYMRHVHFWNFYTQSAALETWVAANGTAFDFWRVDQLFGSDMFGWNYQSCFHCHDGAWLSLSNILCDKATFPFIASASATISVDNFMLITSAAATPAVWVVANTGSIRLSNGQIASTAGVGVQVDDTSTVQIDNVTFSNQHSAVVVTSETSDVYIDNSKWNVPPFGSYNVRVNGERLPNRTTAITLPAPLAAPTVIPGGYQFDLSTAGAKTLQWDTTAISQRNSLYVLEMDWEMVGTDSTWYFQFTIQKDDGSATQVSYAPLYALNLNGTTGAPRKVRIPFFINHGRFKQVMTILVTPTLPLSGAALNLTNIVLYEQGNQYTTDAQVSNMMRAGYNLDAYAMGQTLFSKGKNRIVLTQPEAGVGRPTEVPTSGTWDIGDEVRTYTPTAGGNIGYVCTTAGTPGTWKSYGAISA
jgi:hypothetical protein